MNKKMLVILIGIFPFCFASNQNAQNNNQAVINALNGSGAKTNQAPQTSNQVTTAPVQNSSPSESLVQNKVKNTGESSSAIKKQDPLTDSDVDAVMLNKYKRQAELKKYQNDINKYDSNGKQTNSVPPITTTSSVIPPIKAISNAVSNQVQTVVTGIVVSGNKSYATLLFSDGSTLDVQKGSRIDMGETDYIVTDVNINGVIVNSYNKKGKVQKTIKIKRVYAKDLSNMKGNNQNQSPFSQSPTQTFTNSNFDNTVTNPNYSNNSSGMVPNSVPNSAPSLGVPDNQPVPSNQPVPISNDGGQQPIMN